MTEQPTRRFQLDINRIEGLDDIKKILDALKIRIDTDNPLYEGLKHCFTTEVVPPGYVQLVETIGDEAVAKMSYEEMQKRIEILFENEQTN